MSNANDNSLPLDAVASAEPWADAAARGSVDAAGIAQLYEKYAPAIYAHCRRLLGSSAAARDAMQEAFVRVLLRNRDLAPGDEALRSQSGRKRAE